MSLHPWSALFNTLCIVMIETIGERGGRITEPAGSSHVLCPCAPEDGLPEGDQPGSGVPYCHDNRFRSLMGRSK